MEKLAPSAPGPRPATGAAPTPPRADTQKVAAPSEREKIIAALEACAGNQSRAAELLQMPRRTFVNKLDLYKIPRPKKLQGLRRDDETEN